MMKQPSTLLVMIVCGVMTSNAWASIPHLDGLAGAGRSGIPTVALFSNPAAVGVLKTNHAFYSYMQSKISDLGAGGRYWTAGAYDTTSQHFKGGLAYIRESRRTLTATGSNYSDHTTVRGVIGTRVYKDLLSGMQVNYSTRRAGGEEINYFHGNLGVIYPVMKGLPLGVTLENVTNNEFERPLSGGVGIRHALYQSISVYADLVRVLKGELAGENSWALGSEITIFNDLRFRVGLFKDDIEKIRGLGLGLAWIGPRTTFEYAMRRTRRDPQQVDHSLGIAIIF